MTEELRDPFVNLPRAIYLSLPLVTGIYLLANISYFAVLGPVGVRATEAIAVVSILSQSESVTFIILVENVLLFKNYP